MLKGLSFFSAKVYLEKEGFVEFTHTAEEEVLKQNNLKVYKRNLVGGKRRLFHFINSNIENHLSFDELEKHYKKTFGCEKLIKGK